MLAPPQQSVLRSGGSVGLSEPGTCSCTALARGLLLVIANEAELSLISGLLIENWR